MTVIRRNRQHSCSDLVNAIDTLIPLLRDQGEGEAAGELEASLELLRNAKADSSEQKKAIAAIIEAFEGDHELIAYTFQRENPGHQWTEAEVLSQASARVFTLARRMQ